MVLWFKWKQRSADFRFGQSIYRFLQYKNGELCIQNDELSDLDQALYSQLFTLFEKYEAGTVQGSRGYVIFRETGDCTITLDYASGNNKLQILGIDILDIAGNNVEDSDYHYGTTGTNDSNNSYRKR